MELSTQLISGSPSTLWISTQHSTMSPESNVDLEMQDQTQQLRDLFGDSSDELEMLPPIYARERSSLEPRPSFPVGFCSECSFFTDPPSSPSSPCLNKTQSFTDGVRSCHPWHFSPATEGPSNSSQSPLVENIGGAPLIPGSMCQFKNSSHTNHGKGKRNA